MKEQITDDYGVCVVTAGHDPETNLPKTLMVKSAIIERNGITIRNFDGGEIFMPMHMVASVLWQTAGKLRAAGMSVPAEIDDGNSE